MHRRKTSKENQNVADDTITIAVDPPMNGSTVPSQVPFPNTPHINGNGIRDYSPRSRVNSVPSAFEAKVDETSSSRPPPPSAGPLRTSFGLPGSPPTSNGFAYPGSPFRHSFSHTRTVSTSGIPRGNGFPVSHSLNNVPSRPISMHEPMSPRMHSSFSSPVVQQGMQPPGTLPSPATQSNRRHSRIHSRNLSIFFPRPGSLPHASIAEDGSQEIEYGVHKEAPTTLIPSASPGPYDRSHLPAKPFGEGFTFGGRANSTSSTSSTEAGAVSTQSVRRGHHHKHSMSHNFFSFLEPGQNLSQTSPEPGSPWNSISPLPSSNSVATTLSPRAGCTSPLLDPRPISIPKVKLAVGIAQFLLGATLWVSGQQIGSLGCTGLGYWVVFDAFGVFLEHVLPAYLSFESMKSPLRRPYGNDRIETVSLFAQSIYLIFASVYVCKETVEHILLSLGEGHHHHHFGDESPDHFGIEFPNIYFIFTAISLIGTNIAYGNHTKLIRTSGHKLPSFSSLLKHTRSHNAFPSPVTPTSFISAIVANPFTAIPLLFTISLLVASSTLPPSQHAPFDLLLAAVETILTFSVAYPAAVVLGTVLLQTSPARGMPGGRMESFLRAMREIERHPKVLHLPAPHIWQLTPTNVTPASMLSGPVARDELVVTLELHVRKDLDDDGVLELTKWAHDRCRYALQMGTKGREREEPEVTIGIVRG